MSLISKTCHSCGIPILIGLVECQNCGAKIGTVFSESEPVPTGLSAKEVHRQRVQEHISTTNAIEKAHERANHSVILSLISFFPLLGFGLGPASIYMAIRSIKTMKQYNIEEGRGMAYAGIVIGLTALLAQFSYLMLVYSSKQGGNPFGL
jgi:uncharacterized Zn finger protein (UPF0148 family)